MSRQLQSATTTTTMAKGAQSKAGSKLPANSGTPKPHAQSSELKGQHIGGTKRKAGEHESMATGKKQKPLPTAAETPTKEHKESQPKAPKSAPSKPQATAGVTCLVCF